MMQFIILGSFFWKAVFEKKHCIMLRRKCCIDINALQVFVFMFCAGFYEVCEVGVGVGEH